jgi:hypothetical protein
MSDEGGLELLDKMLKDALSVDEGYLLKLFNVSTLTPSAAMTSNDFTGKTATFTNYSIGALSRSGWSAATTSNNTAVAVYSSAISWTCGATGDTIYGYMLEAATSHKVLWAEKYSVARVMGNGDILNIIPKFTIATA